MHTISISANIARNLARFTSKEETRPNLNGIRFERLGNNFRAIATDGHKLLAAFGEMQEFGTIYGTSFTLVIDKAVPKNCDRLEIQLPEGTIDPVAGRLNGGSNGYAYAVAQLVSDRRGIVGAVPVRLLDPEAFRFPDWQRVFPQELTARPMVTEANPAPELTVLPSSVNPALVGSFALDHLPQTRIVWSGSGNNPEGRAICIQIFGDDATQWAGLIMPMREAERMGAVPEWVHQPVPKLTLVRESVAA